MSQTQFLLLLLAIIPIANCIIFSIFYDNQVINNIINKASSILFFAPLIGLCGGLSYSDNLVFNTKINEISLVIAIDKITINFLWLLGFLWIILNFYSHRFSTLSKDENINSLKFFLSVIISILTLLILSKNLVSWFLFYSILLFLLKFFAEKFLYKKRDIFSQIFNLIFTLQSFAFFLAIFLTYNFTKNLDFIDLNNLSYEKTLLLIFLYSFALFAFILAPFYLIFYRFNVELIFIYLFCFLSYALPVLCLLTKFQFLPKNIDRFMVIFIELIFLANIAISSLFLIFSKTIKTSFLHIFFQQLVFAIFAIFIFTLHDKTKIYFPTISFGLNISLFFVLISNLALYLNNSKDKDIIGIFYKMRINGILMLFCLASLIGAAPSISTIQNLSLMKIATNNHLFLPKIILTLYYLSLIIFSFKLLYPLLSPNSLDKSPEDLDLINQIESDSSLILAPTILALSLILSLIFSSFLIYG